MSFYLGSLVIIFHVLFRNVADGINVNGDNNYGKTIINNDFNFDDYNYWTPINKKEFLNSYEDEFSNESFLENKSSVDDGNINLTDTGTSNKSSKKGHGRSRVRSASAAAILEEDDSKDDMEFKASPSVVKTSTPSGTQTSGLKSSSPSVTKSSSPSNVKSASPHGESNSSEESTTKSSKRSASVAGIVGADEEAPPAPKNTLTPLEELYPTNVNLFNYKYSLNNMEENINILKNEGDLVAQKEEFEYDENMEKAKQDKKKALEKIGKESDEEPFMFSENKFLENQVKERNVAGSFSRFFSKLIPFKKDEVIEKTEVSKKTFSGIGFNLTDKEAKVLGVGVTYQEYPETMLYNCPNNSNLFDTIESLQGRIIDIKKRESMISTTFEQQKECLKNMGVLDLELNDTQCKFGTCIGSFGEHHLRLYEFENDLFKFHPNIDYLTLADGYKLQKNHIYELSHVNFCLLNPKTLEEFLKKKEIKDLMGGDDLIKYKENFDNFMSISITCHIESLIYDDIEASQDIAAVLKIAKSKLHVITSGLSYKARKLVYKIYSEIQKNPDELYEKLTWIYDNIYMIKRYYTAYALEGVCSYLEHDKSQMYTELHIYNKIVDSVRYYSSCFKNVIVYNAIISGIHEKIKHFLKLVPRHNFLLDYHFNSIFEKEIKPAKKYSTSHIYFDPTVASYAYYNLDRRTMVTIINDYFEAKKKELTVIVSRMKTDMLSLQNEESKIPNDKSANSKLATRLMKKFKAEIRDFFKEMRIQYAKLINIRYGSHLKKNYFAFKRSD
uniref:Rhoptry-associated protein 1 n=1 Tax=Plasmodium falciparum TaxID=5833 RepID=D7NSU4_PLAFA|nr:rhoptry-associated protein 1 [Plasmodium falciparum]